MYRLYNKVTKGLEPIGKLVKQVDFEACFIKLAMVISRASC